MVTVLSDNAVSVAKSRYFFDDTEDWQGLSIRCGTNNGRVEEDKSFIDKFIEIIYSLEFLPAGRILRNSGRIRGSLFNCYGIPVDDSIGDIGQWLKDCLETWSEGGGVGTNISSLRPSEAIIRGKGGNSSGPVSFLCANDACANTIQSGGQRRAAGMAFMLASHPEILNFIEAKMVDKILKHFNISVGVNEEFIEAVEKDNRWDLTFNHQKYNTVDAKTIWDKILYNMIHHAEPGILNWDNLRSNNSYYFDPIITVNPCGEAPLGAYGVCCLGSINLLKFVTNINTNWKRMEEVIRISIRFLDNIIDINKYILPQYDKAAHNGRRIGLGMLGMAEYLFAKKIRYGSPKAIQEAEKVTKFIRDISYDESIKLAVEKGAFPAFDPVYFGKSNFIRTLSPSVRMDIKKYGIRNVTLNAIAPNGTISLIPEVTGSIEPLPAKAFLRKDRVGERFYIHPLFKQLVEENKLNEVPEWFVDCFDLKPTDHLDMQVAVQKYIDGAVSKTINMPKGTKEEDLSALLLEYIHDLKGVTVYVDGSRENQPINKIDIDEAVKYILQGKEEKETTCNLTPDDVKCSNGKCEL